MTTELKDLSAGLTPPVIRDIVVTWPKSRTLESYLDELSRACDAGLVINFRVASLPKESITGARCYMVHDGFVRGFNHIISLTYREDNEVLDPVTGFYWPRGFYIVRDPRWTAIPEEIPMTGFQGWRYWTRPTPEGSGTIGPPEDVLS